MPICVLMILGMGLLCADPAAGPVPLDTSCQAFEPLRWSSRDTRETIRQAREHNAAFDTLCERSTRSDR